MTEYINLKTNLPELEPALLVDQIEGGDNLTPGGRDLIAKWRRQSNDKHLQTYAELAELVLRESQEVKGKAKAYTRNGLAEYCMKEQESSETIEEMTAAEAARKLQAIARTCADRLDKVLKKQLGPSGIISYAGNAERCPVLCATKEKEKHYFIVELPTQIVSNASEASPPMSVIQNDSALKGSNTAETSLSQSKTILLAIGRTIGLERSASRKELLLAIGLILVLIAASRIFVSHDPSDVPAISRINLHPEMRGRSMVLSIDDERGTARGYLVYVHPRGWQASGIRVARGDKYEVRAFGQVTVGMDAKVIANNFDIVEDREQRLNEDNTLTPEALDKEAVARGKMISDKFRWRWVGVEGYGELDRKSKRPEFVYQDKTLLSTEHAQGALLAFATDKQIDPEYRIVNEREKGLVSVVSDRLEVGDAPPNAELYFAVNDSYERQWQYDNFGSYLLWLIRTERYR